MFDQVSEHRHALRTNFFSLFDEVLLEHCSDDIKALLAEAAGEPVEHFEGFGEMHTTVLAAVVCGLSVTQTDRNIYICVVAGDRIVLFMRWFQCLFLSVLPFSTAFRVWDTFLATAGAAFDASPSAGVGCILRTAIALVCVLAEEFALLRQVKAQEAVKAAEIAATARAAAAIANRGTIFFEEKNTPNSRELDGDGLMKLLVSTLDKRARWMQTAWRNATQGDRLIEQVRPCSALHDFCTSRRPLTEYTVCTRRTQSFSPPATARNCKIFSIKWLRAESRLHSSMETRCCYGCDLMQVTLLLYSMYRHTRTMALPMFCPAIISTNASAGWKPWVKCSWISKALLSINSVMVSMASSKNYSTVKTERY